MALDNNTVLNYTDKTTIKNWFKTGLKPTQTQFWSTWDSFWHKSESLPISSINGLGDLIDGKAETEHTHSEYAKNDATSLTAQNITQWQNKLGVDDLDYVEIPTEDASVESHPYVVVIDNEGNSARRNATDFGKVDTIDGIEADENKNIALGAVRKSESNEVEAGFDLHQVDGASISVSTNGLKVFKGGITATFGTTSIYVDNLVPDAAYKFQEILFPKRAVKNVEEKVYPVTYIQGVKADETGRVDISGIAWNYTSPSIRYSGILDKSADATYNNLLGVDSNGYTAKVGLNAVTNVMSKATDAQKDAFRLASRKSTEGYSVGVPRVDYILPNIIANNKDEITYVSVVGLNLLLNLQDCEVRLINVATNQEYLVSVIQTIAQSSSMFSFGFNFYNKPVGDYRIFVRNGIQTNIDTTVFTLVESIPTVPLAVNFNRYFKEGLSEAYKNTFTTGVNYISKNKDTQALGNTPIADFVSETPIVIDSAKDFVFTCLFTISTGPSGYLGDAQLGLTQGFVNNIYNTVQYGVRFTFINLISTLTSKNLVTGLLNSSKKIQIQIIKRGSILSVITSVDGVYSSDVAAVNIVNPLYFIFKNNSANDNLGYVTTNPIVINLLSLQYLN